MRQALQFALLGLGTGAMYTLLGQGLVMVFRGSGVLNLAHGAFAMVAAYLFNTLHVDHAWALAPALIASIAAAMALGVATDQALLRRLRRSSPLARLMGTLGVLIVAESAVSIVWGSTPINVFPIMTPNQVHLLGVTTTSDRLWLLAIAAGLTAVLTYVWRYTRAGWLTEAVSEDQVGVAALGWSPELLSAATWALGAGLAGAAGILVSPITQLSPLMVLIVIPALAAALIGGFRSFPATLLGGLVLGIAESEAGLYVHVTGAADAVPFLLIVIVLVVKGSSLPLRGHVFDRLPAVGIGRIDVRRAAPAVVGGVLVVSLISSPDWLDALTATCAIATVLLSLVVLVGYAGQLSLAQYALAGIGALVAARIMATQGWPFELAAVAGILVAMGVGVAFALPALRTRGVNLAVVTLGLGLTVQSVVFDNPKYTGGLGGTNVGSLRLFGWNITPADHPGRYAVMVFVLFVACALIVANLRRGRSGRRFLAIRANERAAAASGVNVLGTKVHAFAISGAIAGLGGILLGFQSTTVTFGAFNPFNSISAVAQVVIGGSGFVLGAPIGATLAPSSFGALVAQAWQSIFEYLGLIAGVGMMISLVANPDGIVSGLAAARRRLLSGPLTSRPRVSRTSSAHMPSAIFKVPPRPLEISHLTVRYGGVVAVDDIDLAVESGEVVSLIGPNGAGKTSLMDAVTGFTRSSGSVRFDHTVIDRWPPHRRARAGLVRTFQGLELFADMTVLENLQVAAERDIGWSPATDMIKPDRSVLPGVALAAIDEFELCDCLDRFPEELSYGQRRLVAIARAVAMEPSVLLLDEPVAGLHEHESDELARLVRRLADDWGMGVLVIEHDMGFVMAISDRIVVMDFAAKIAEGTPSEIRADPRTIAAYLGQGLEHEANDMPVGVERRALS